MHELTEQVNIGATLDAVWRAVVDFPGRARYSPRVKRVEVAGGPALAVGTRIKLEVGRRAFEPVVEEIVAPSRLVLRIAAPGFRAHHVYEVQPAGDATSLTVRGAYGGLLGGVLARVMGGSFRRDLADEARGIKAAAEGTGGAHGDKP